MSRSAYLPTVEYSGALNRLSRKSVLPGVGVIDVGGPSSEALTRRLKGQSSESTVNLTWILYDFGLREANQRYARELLRSALAAHDRVIQNVFFETARGYYELKAARALRESAAQSVEMAAQIRDATAEIHAAGVGSLSNKLQAQTAFDQARLELADAEQRMQVSGGDFATQMGFGPQQPILLVNDVLDVHGDLPILKRTVENLVADASASHPEILEAGANMRVAQAEVSALRARGRPVVSLAGAYRKSDTPAAVSQQEIFTDKLVGLRLEVPIFDGFLRRYQVRQARAKVMAREAELETARLRVTLEVWSSYQVLHSEAQRIELADSLLASAQRQFEISQGQFKSGHADIMQLLKSQVDLVSADRARITALTRWHIARYRLIASVAALDGSLLLPPASPS